VKEADALLAEHPELRSADLHLAAILGDADAVRDFLRRDPASVNVRNGPYQADALNYLGLSKYLRLDPARSDGFIRSATALLDAGADARTGFWTTGKFPEFETALYGAAGVAHHRALTQLLLERGADPNDEEAVYHSPESYDLGAMKALVETGRLTADSLSLMLIRKLDWHDVEGVRYLLKQAGADPKHHRTRGSPALNHAVARDNSVEIVGLLLDHGADPMAIDEDGTALANAAARGRGDLIRLFRQRQTDLPWGGGLGLVIAFALGDAAQVESIVTPQPALLKRVVDDGGRFLARFAANDNAKGVALLLDRGVPVDARYAGDPYFDIAPYSTALHAASWRARPDVMKVLIARGADVNAKDGKGRTPLMLAVKAAVDSYWTARRTPDGVRMLLDAGASLAGVPYPSGYDAVDVLLAAAGAARKA
jgi:ankyrin repeat protein